MSSALMVLGGSSRQSLATARTCLDKVIKGLSAQDVASLATDLFTMVATLDSSTPLRRALTDSATQLVAKNGLVEQLFGPSLSKSAIALLKELIALPWSKPSHLGNVIEQLAIEAEASAANLAGELDQLESEIFAFSQIVAGDTDLRQALNSSKYSGEGKRVLIAKLFGNKVSASAARLLAALVSGLRGRNIEGTIAFYATATAQRRNRIIAHVRSAIPLTDSQQTKLARSLEEKIGQPVRLNVEVDPTVLGGISIRFADELIDATVISRLADAGRTLAG